MHENDLLVEGFEANRAHLRSVAYRMLGSLTESADAVQEAWLRLARADTSDVRNLGGWNLGGWLTTVIARVSWTCPARADRGGRTPSTSTCPTRSSASPMNSGAPPGHNSVGRDAGPSAHTRRIQR